MTYKLNPELRLITSPITLIFPGGVRHSYSSGVAVANKTFNERYRVVEVREVEGTVEIELEQMKVLNVNPIGEETFFL